MFNYNFDISKLILQNRNPFVIIGNVIDYLKALIKPMNSIKSEMLSFINTTRNKEQYTFQVASMEALLNDLYSPFKPNIQIVTLKATNVVPLANRYTGTSALGTKGSVKGWFLPNKSQALVAAGISDNFIVYVEPSVLAVHKFDIIDTINYYKFSGLQFQVRANNDIINPDVSNGFESL